MTVSRRARTLRLGAVSYFTGLILGLCAGRIDTMAKNKELGLAQSTEEASPALLAELKAAHAEEVGQLQADNVRLLDLVAAHEEAIAARDAMQRATARQQQAVATATQSGAIARTMELAKARG